MAVQPPKIDKRTYDDIVGETKRLLEKYAGSYDVQPSVEALNGRTLAADVVTATGRRFEEGTTIDPVLAQAIYENVGSQLVKLYGWKPRQGGQTDIGEALVGIFAHMMEPVIERLNQSPEDTFLAFLDMIGVRQLPPRPARTPLTFYLAAGTQMGAVTIPARTQVAASDEPTVVFETNEALTVHWAQLQAIFVHDPIADQFADYSSLSPMETPTGFSAFAGRDLVKHSLYLACDPFFLLPEPKTVTLTFASTDAEALSKLQIAWSNVDEVEFKPNSISVENGLWIVSFEMPSALVVREVDGVSKAWLRALLKEKPTPTLPQITNISAIVTIGPHDEPVTKLVAFADALRLDLSKEFYLFGEKPRRGSVFYLTVPTVFESGKNNVTVDFDLDETAKVGPSPDLRIVWEALTDNGWELLCHASNISTQLTKAAKKGDQQLSVASVDKLSDSDYLVIGPGKDNWEVHQIERIEDDLIYLSQPLSEDHDATVEVIKCESVMFTASGKLTFKLPAPMAKGIVNGESGYWLRARILAGNYGMEETYDVKIAEGKITEYDHRKATFAPPIVKSLTLTYEYISSELPISCKTLNNFVFEDHAAPVNGMANPFIPFKKSPEKNPALYLGFDRPLPNQGISLYWNVMPTPNSDNVKPDLTWEYSTADSWKQLYLLDDETQNFTKRGIVSFIGPSDLQQRREFCMEFYWIRVVCKNGDLVTQPQVDRILTNTGWASQTMTIPFETLGSGTGEANQFFTTTKAPVVEKVQIEVRETEMPTADREVIERDEGRDAIQHTPSAEIWVRWHEVSDFYASGPRSRHFIFDHLTGQVRFGDGRYGMAPPRARNNIRAVAYRTGGGKQGNRPAQTITQLKTTLPYVDRVINYEPAEGGADAEPIDGVKERGPKRLRHYDRAVTVTDFEDLAFEASPDVARVRAIDEGKGKVVVVIVPRSDNPKPEPPLALREDVAAYFRQRCAPAAQVQVCGPEWMEVKVEVTVVPVSVQSANTLVASVESALQRFLHPITGASDQQGWTFGRRPYKSDIYALLETVEGVNYVHNLELTMTPPIAKDKPLSKRLMIFSGQHTVKPGATG